MCCYNAVHVIAVMIIIFKSTSATPEPALVSEIALMLKWTVGESPESPDANITDQSSNNHQRG
jgi:hypothetical protein